MAARTQSVVAIDDDTQTLDRLASILEVTHKVRATSDPHRAAAWLQTDEEVVAVIVSQDLKAAKAITVLEAAKKLRPDARRILIANYAHLNTFVDGLHSGAIQRTISRPIDETEVLSLLRIPIPLSASQAPMASSIRS